MELIVFCNVLALRLEKKKEVTKYEVMKVCGLFGPFSYNTTDKAVKLTVREPLNP